MSTATRVRTGVLQNRGFAGALVLLGVSADRIHRLPGGRPIRHISTGQSQSR